MLVTLRKLCPETAKEFDSESEIVLYRVRPFYSKHLLLQDMHGELGWKMSNTFLGQQAL